MRLQRVLHRQPRKQALRSISRAGGDRIGRVVSRDWVEQVTPAMAEERLTEEYLQHRTVTCPGCGVHTQRVND